jgi:hypothetical protein
VQAAHFLAASDFAAWAARLCTLSPSLNKGVAPPSSAQLSAPIIEAVQRRCQRQRAQSAQCAALQLLDSEGEDFASAVLAAHPLLTSAQPLGRRLACLPPRLHVAAVRAATHLPQDIADDEQPALVIDVTDAHSCSQIAQACSDGQLSSCLRLLPASICSTCKSALSQTSWRQTYWHAHFDARQHCGTCAAWPLYSAICVQLLMQRLSVSCCMRACKTYNAH